MTNFKISFKVLVAVNSLKLKILLGDTEWGNLKKSKMVESIKAWIRLKGMKRDKKRLESLWKRLINDIREFLKRDDLNFNDFYEMLDSIGILFKEIEAEPIEEEFWQRCFELANIDDLVDIIKYQGEYSIEKAWQEIEKRILGGHIRKDEAQKALMRIMREKADNSSRIKALQLFKTIEPSLEKIEELRKLPIIYSSPPLQREIEKMFKETKKREKRKSRQKIIKAILETIEEINKLKKGQE